MLVSLHFETRWTLSTVSFVVVSFLVGSLSGSLDRNHGQSVDHSEVPTTGFGGSFNLSTLNPSQVAFVFSFWGSFLHPAMAFGMSCHHTMAPVSQALGWTWTTGCLAGAAPRARRTPRGAGSPSRASTTTRRRLPMAQTHFSQGVTVKTQVDEEFEGGSHSEVVFVFFF